MVRPSYALIPHVHSVLFYCLWTKRKCFLLHYAPISPIFPYLLFWTAEQKHLSTLIWLYWKHVFGFVQRYKGSLLAEFRSVYSCRSSKLRARLSQFLCTKSLPIPLLVFLCTKSLPIPLLNLCFCALNHFQFHSLTCLSPCHVPNSFVPATVSETCRKIRLKGSAAQSSVSWKWLLITRVSCHWLRRQNRIARVARIPVLVWHGYSSHCVSPVSIYKCKLSPRIPVQLDTVHRFSWCWSISVICLILCLKKEEDLNVMF